MAWTVDLENTLQEKISFWLNLTSPNEVNEFYTREILPLSLKKFKASYHNPNYLYDSVIMPLGNSWQALVHSMSVLSSDEFFILYSPETRKYLDFIYHYADLRPSSIISREIKDSNNALEVYKAIKEYFTGKSPQKAAVDFTGGTKSMSIGSLLAGTVLGIKDFFYIGNEPGTYIDKFRRPRPGSEIMVKVEHPLAVFGDLEAEKAKSLAFEYNYRSAALIYNELLDKVPDPREFELYYLLLSAYEAWDNLELKQAFLSMQKLLSKITQYSSEYPQSVFTRNLPILVQQHAFLQKLQILNQNKNVEIFKDRKLAIALLMTIYTNALRREKQGKLDMAALLLYRILEMVSQFTLLLNYGLDTAHPDYSKLPVAESELLALFTEEYRRLGLRQPSELPLQISLMQGYILLKVLNDPLTSNLDLRALSGQSEIRNNTIFAHGFSFIRKESYQKFKSMVQECLARFLIQNDTCLEKELDKFSFIIL
ncbi:TIGR02710 family CRISPR-associated CARF protein [Thermosyntropha sp.]|uniref:TIGR02710 family CRISPR-associated CARF protein n=1 Tax=Thermosyntropha sp. TaxID=2740820 RepID=UPI0025EE616C|nr:TIGR02710 family CRISPR-associated CARF protein [Thermosyntropha sp.]MBO8159678.1 TIGR02710 family CRISPR-associated protein [Thermosyntropha sp.]